MIYEYEQKTYPLLVLITLVAQNVTKFDTKNRFDVYNSRWSLYISSYDSQNTFDQTRVIIMLYL